MSRKTFRCPLSLYPNKSCGTGSKSGTRKGQAISHNTETSGELPRRHRCFEHRYPKSFCAWRQWTRSCHTTGITCDMLKRAYRLRLQGLPYLSGHLTRPNACEAPTLSPQATAIRRKQTLRALRRDCSPQVSRIISIACCRLRGQWRHGGYSVLFRSRERLSDLRSPSPSYCKTALLEYQGAEMTHDTVVGLAALSKHSLH